MQSSDLGLLVALDALLQEGSVSGAARRLGLSTPATSHALARARQRVGDAVLVRSGRGMVLTPRAEALRDRVHMIVREARAALEPEAPFVAHELARGFVVHATDYVLHTIGFALDRILSAEAPKVNLRFFPNSLDDANALRDGSADLAVGIYGALPQEMRRQPLLTDRFVAVVRADHPRVGKRLTLERYLELAHVQVAPRGRPGGYLDDVLREKKLVRRVARAVPYFASALELVARTDYVVTISERFARRSSLPLKILPVPLKLAPYALSLVWHPRFDGDLGHRLLRTALLRAAKEEASDRHDDARTRLDTTDPTSGETRRRPRRR